MFREVFFREVYGFVFFRFVFCVGIWFEFSIINWCYVRVWSWEDRDEFGCFFVVVGLIGCIWVRIIGSGNDWYFMSVKLVEDVVDFFGVFFLVVLFIWIIWNGNDEGKFVVIYVYESLSEFEEGFNVVIFVVNIFCEIGFIVSREWNKNLLWFI